MEWIVIRRRHPFVMSVPRTTLRRIPLGNARDVLVTDVCLGTMTWGVQNTEEEAHAQLDYAVKERGVNFIDTAEMYPVPSSDSRWKPGRTEEIIGNWLEKNQELRKELVVATKVSGYQAKSETAGNRTTPPGAPAPARPEAWSGSPPSRSSPGTRSLSWRRRALSAALGSSPTNFR